MTALYDSHAKKKATNLSINSDLLKKAKELNLENQVTFKLMDYREINEKFDKK